MAKKKVQRETLAFKTQIVPDAHTRQYFEQAFGIRRWVYNWCVATYFGTPTQPANPLPRFQLQSKLNNEVVGSKGKEWLKNVNTMVRQESIKDFALALETFFSSHQEAIAKGKPLAPDENKPKFKKKGKCTDSFRIMHKNETAFRYHSPHKISLVGVGHSRIYLKTRESVAFLADKYISTCTVSRKAGKYYASFTYEKTNRVLPTTEGKVGLDLGIEHIATGFDGVNDFVIDVPKNIRVAEKRTEKLQAANARAVKGSNRQRKILQRLQRAYVLEANIKKDFREKATTALVQNYAQINIDNFNFEGALNLKNAHRALYRVGVYEFKLRLEQKAKERGVQVNYVAAFTPTTQTCSYCGSVHKVELQERSYFCPDCGFATDRDLNGAINTYNYS